MIERERESSYDPCLICSWNWSGLFSLFFFTSNIKERIPLCLYYFFLPRKYNHSKSQLNSYDFVWRSRAVSPAWYTVICILPFLILLLFRFSANKHSCSHFTCQMFQERGLGVSRLCGLGLLKDHFETQKGGWGLFLLWSFLPPLIYPSCSLRWFQIQKMDLETERPFKCSTQLSVQFRMIGLAVRT